MPEASQDSVAPSPHCLVEKRGHVLIVTMNRPEAKNALSSEMMAIMRDAWDQVDADPDIRVAVLTGAGGSFCAGADLKAMTTAPPGESISSGGSTSADSTSADSSSADSSSAGPTLDVTTLPALLKGRRLTKPLIAAVEGPAIAGGTEILQGTDIRVAGVSAKFGVSEAKWGLFPLGGSAVRLVRQVPYTLAAEMLLTGRHITAPEALEYGLVGHVVPDGQALEKALELADVVAANGPVAVQAILKTIRDTEGLHEEEAFTIEAKTGVSVFKSKDAKEGPRAFAEKRQPAFTGE